MMPVIYLLAAAYAAFQSHDFSALPVAEALRSEFVATETWDCKIPGSVIEILGGDINPSPIVYPGNVFIDSDFRVTQDIPSENMFVKLSLEKQEPTKMSVPCFQGMGSCTYDVCNDVIPNNEAAFCAMGICKCPFTANTYKGSNIPYTLPKKGGPIFAKIMVGNYIGNMTFYNSATNVVYGCMGMKFAIIANTTNLD